MPHAVVRRRVLLDIRVLMPDDAEAYQSLRLAGLAECPSAFASSHAEESGLPLETVADRLSPKANGVVFGAFVQTGLVGAVGVYRESPMKLAHKAHLWGVYVMPASRRCGVGQKLLAEALAFAAVQLQVRQINLGVNAGNTAAIRLYERLGFRQFGFERAYMLIDGVAHDEIYMVCQLPIEAR